MRDENPSVLLIDDEVARLLRTVGMEGRPKTTSAAICLFGTSLTA